MDSNDDEYLHQCSVFSPLADLVLYIVKLSSNRYCRASDKISHRNSDSRAPIAFGSTRPLLQERFCGARWVYILPDRCWLWVDVVIVRRNLDDVSSFHHVKTGSRSINWRCLGKTITVTRKHQESQQPMAPSIGGLTWEKYPKFLVEVHLRNWNRPSKVPRRRMERVRAKMEQEMYWWREWVMMNVSTTTQSFRSVVRTSKLSASTAFVEANLISDCKSRPRHPSGVLLCSIVMKKILEGELGFIYPSAPFNLRKQVRIRFQVSPCWLNRQEETRKKSKSKECKFSISTKDGRTSKQRAEGFDQSPVKFFKGSIRRGTRGCKNESRIGGLVVGVQGGQGDDERGTARGGGTYPQSIFTWPREYSFLEQHNIGVFLETNPYHLEKGITQAAPQIFRFIPRFTVQ